MPPQIGYLLPTRERVMEGWPQTAPLLELAARAEGLGFDSVWVGDSLLARPRHDPLTLLASALLLLLVAVAACVVPAWRAATIDPMRALRTE